MKGTIRKDGSSWTYLVYIGTDLNGKKKYKRKRGFRTKKECQLALAELITQIEKGTIITNDKMTIKKYMDYWIETYPKTHCEPSTYKRYLEFNKDITYYLGNYKLSKLNPLIIQKFYSDLLKERNLSNNTVIKIHRMFHLALKHAQKWQLINNNPCELVTPPKAIKTKMKYWEPQNININLNKLQGHKLYPITFLAIHTGCRVGELCALTWDDVNFKNNTLIINKTLQRINGKLQIKKPKTKNSTRTIILFASTLLFLKKLKTTAQQRKLEYGIELKYIFCWEDGRPIDPHYVSQNFPKALNECDIEKIRFHDLRHTHATLLLSQNINPKIISERLGHSTVSFTLDTYSHVNLNMQKQEMSKIEKIL